MIKVSYFLVLLYVMYVCTACATPHEHKIDQIYVKENNYPKRKILLHNLNYFDIQKTNSVQNKVIKIPNEVEISYSRDTQLQKLLKEDFNKINREIDRELLEKDRINRTNSILFYNPYRSEYHDRLKAIIRDNEKATAYYNNQKNSKLKQ